MIVQEFVCVVVCVGDTPPAKRCIDARRSVFSSMISSFSVHFLRIIGDDYACGIVVCHGCCTDEPCTLGINTSAQGCPRVHMEMCASGWMRGWLRVRVLADGEHDG